MAAMPSMPSVPMVPFLRSAVAGLLLLSTRGAEVLSAQAGCPTTVPTGQPARLSLAAVAGTTRDTVTVVRLCLALPPGIKVGSFHLEITYDSLRARATVARPAPSGTQAANVLVPGLVAIAGAAPAGFARGTLSTIVFRRRGGAVGGMRVTLLELNAVDGSSLLSRAVAQGLGVLTPSPTLTAAPVLERLDPATTAIVPGGVAQVMIHGRGFTSTGNVLMFGSAVLGDLPSSDGSTLRLLVPNAWPSSGEAPPRVIDAGVYSIRVRNTRGLSNSISLTLTSP